MAEIDIRQVRPFIHIPVPTISFTPIATPNIIGIAKLRYAGYFLAILLYSAFRLSCVSLSICIMSSKLNRFSAAKIQRNSVFPNFSVKKSREIKKYHNFNNKKLKMMRYFFTLPSLFNSSKKVLISFLYSTNSSTSFSIESSFGSSIL